MSDSSRTAAELPLLPLRDIVVFPHMVVPLFVGREKSIAALEEAMRHDKGILLAAQKLAPTLGATEAATVATGLYRGAVDPLAALGMPSLMDIPMLRHLGESLRPMLQQTFEELQRGRRLDASRPFCREAGLRRSCRVVPRRDDRPGRDRGRRRGVGRGRDEGARCAAGTARDHPLRRRGDVTPTSSPSRTTGVAAPGAGSRRR